VTLRSVDTVKNIFEALKTSHHGFPGLNHNEQVIGLIPKNFVFVLIAKRNFYSHANQKYFVVNGAIQKYLKEQLSQSRAPKDDSSHSAVHKTSFRVDDDEEFVNDGSQYDDEDKSQREKRQFK
jgi:hypothetical protein